MQPISILYQDQDLMVINKPAGVVVNEAKTVKEETIQKWFWEKHELTEAQISETKKDWQKLVPEDFTDEYGTPEEIFALRQGIVHRLDKETSGALILAKNPGSLANLLSQFKKRIPSKKYLCLAHGKFGVPEDIISFPLGRASENRLKFSVKIEGREAVTHYKVLDFFGGLDLEKLKLSGKAALALKKNKNSYQGFSLVECWPKTGRTHQIRVHLRHIKHPLAGDKLYLGRKRKKLDPFWCGRHFLHASQITFTHPATGKELRIEAELSQDLKDVLELLKK